MKRFAHLGKGLFANGVAAAITLAALAATADAGRLGGFRPCICPDVYAPVICSNGFVYSNYCVAGCYGATGCVPYGDATF